jgi:hypothetical protein
MNMFVRSAFAVSFAALAGFASTANAQTTPHRAPHKAVQAHAKTPLEASPLPPGVELQTSTSAPTGSENHYFSDTVASGQNDLMDMSYRYGQPSSVRYGSGPEPLFHF